MHKFKIIVSMVLFSFFSCSEENADLIKKEEVKDQILFFEKGINYEELSSLLINKTNVQVFHDFDIDGELFTGGISNLDGVSSQSEFNEFVQKGINSFAADVLEKREADTGVYSMEMDMKNNYLIDKIIIPEFSERDFVNLKQDISARKIDFSLTKPERPRVISARSKKKKVKIRIRIRGKFQKRNLPNKNWIPDYGGYSCNESKNDSNKRFVLQFMKWNNPDFKFNRTYEQDFILNNSDNSSLGPGVYLSTEEQWFKRPKPIFWVSSLPAPYLDTRASDKKYVKAYTIGCADAEDIEANKWYLTYMLFNKGIADRDNASISAQIGQGRAPNFSPSNSTYFIFGIGKAIPIYSAWEVSVPGSGLWKK